MRRPVAEPTKKPLTPESLVGDFGLRSELARQTVAVFSEALTLRRNDVVEQWQRLYCHGNVFDVERFSSYAPTLARRYGVSTDSLHPASIWFAIQSYYAAVVRLLVERFVSWSIDEFPEGNPYRWCFTDDSPKIVQQIGRLSAALEPFAVASTTPEEERESDLFKALYQNLFPRRLRHRLGEFYTPDWLARHVLDQVGFTGEQGQRVLDPACGSGTFLMLALQRIRPSKRNVATKDSSHADAACESFIQCRSIAGSDINPLAVLTARANYVIALHELLPRDTPVELPIYLADSILAPPDNATFAEPFDFVVGNPPWIAWDNLSDEYRAATAALWRHYGLFTLSASEARHGGGKKDLSMLMLYAAADRYLRPGGRLGMVVTQTLFQTQGAGDGFRRFRLGSEGATLKVLRVDDMVALRPFDDAANWTSTIVLQKGSPTTYPTPYFRWRESKEAAADSMGFVQQGCFATPVDPTRPSSPWLIQTEAAIADASTDESPAHVGPSDYVAHLGANSGGANGVYWLEILDQREDGVLIRNVSAKSKQELPTVEQVIEPDLLYPLLRWSDVARFHASSQRYLLMAQNPASRTGIDETIMRTQYPRTYAYLEQFRELLAGRAAYRRYQNRGAFYSMYNIGQYTLAPIKVVWRRMDRQINAVVVEAANDPWLGLRPVVPQETCVIVACDTLDEAHYLCAVLNGDSVNERVAAHSVRGGKGFGTPGMLEYLGLRRFCPDNPRHRELAARSRQSHAAATPTG